MRRSLTYRFTMRSFNAALQTMCGIVVAIGVATPITAGGQVLRGSITDTAGAPIPGAEIRIFSLDGAVPIAVDTLRPPRTAFTLSVTPPKRRYVIDVVGACAPGFAPQQVAAPFAPGDTLQIAFKLAPALRRGAIPLGQGACAWQTDPVARYTIAPRDNFASEAARTADQIERIQTASPKDSAAAAQYWRGIVSALADTLNNARTPDARARAAYMVVRSLSSYNDYYQADDPALHARLRHVLPADSRWWTTEVAGVQNTVGTLFSIPDAKDTTQAAAAIRRDMLAYLERMESGIGEPEIQNEARYELARMAHEAGDSARMRLELTRMLREQPNYSYSKLAASHLSATTPLRVGAIMPAFDFAPLPDTSRAHVTNAAIAGRYTIVAFWGTWCGPCIREIPALADLYAKYHVRGLEIISVAADESPVVVNEFRSRRYAMPWINAFGGDTEAPALQRIGVVSYPTTVVVDNRGAIIVARTMRTPEELSATVDRLFAK